MKNAKQIVLRQYPKAKCFELWPGSRLYRVTLDGIRPTVPSKEEYDQISPSLGYGATASEAWGKVAKIQTVT